MTLDDFDRNIRGRYFSHCKRIASARVMHGDPPRETEVTFEQYDVLGIEFVLLWNSETKDTARVFVPGDAGELKARLRELDEA